MTSGPSTIAGPARTSFRDVTPRFLALPLLVLLGIEFVLGISLNLFVTLPSGAGVVAVLTSSAVLDLHIAVAVMIVGITGRSLALSVRSADRRARWGSAIGLGSALIATAAGTDFAFNGQSSIASLVMSLGFVGVLVGAVLMRLSTDVNATRSGSAVA